MLCFLFKKFAGSVFPLASDIAVLSKFWKSATVNVILRSDRLLQSLVRFNCGELIVAGQVHVPVPRRRQS